MENIYRDMCKCLWYLKILVALRYFVKNNVTKLLTFLKALEYYAQCKKLNRLHYFFLLLKLYIKNVNLIVKASLKRRFKKWFTCMASDLARLALFMTSDCVLFRNRSIVARYRMMLQIITAPPFPISIDVKLIWNMWLLNVVGMYVGWPDWLVCV